MRKALNLSFSVMFGVGLTTQAVADPNQCARLIPDQGAYKVTLANGQTSTFSSSKDFFCSDAFTDYAQSGAAGGGITVPIDGVPVGANFNTSNASHMQARQRFCQDASAQFSHQESNYLFIKEGDKTLVAAYLQCLALQTASDPLLSAQAVPHTSDVFDVAVISKPVAGIEQPLIVAVKPVSGATAVLDDAFKPGGRIPLAIPGASPLRGTYRFNNDAQDALVLVRTTIGDQLVTAKRCPTGTAGTWSVVADVSHPTQVPHGAYFGPSHPVPQAHCHPHCHPGEGDWYDFTDAAPSSDIVLKNPKFRCDGGGCPFADGSIATLVDDQHIRVHFDSRSAAVSVIAVADMFKKEDNITREPATHGTLKFDQPFSVQMPNVGHPTLEIESELGHVSYATQTLQANQQIDWLALVGAPQVQPAGTTFNLKVSQPSCRQ